MVRPLDKAQNKYADRHLKEAYPDNEANLSYSNDFQEFAQGRENVDDVPPHTVLDFEIYEEFPTNGKKLRNVNIDYRKGEDFGGSSVPMRSISCNHPTRARAS